MNNRKRGMLYDKTSQLIAKVDYEEVEDKIFIRVLEQVVECMPKEAFLVMKTGSNHNIAFLISLYQMDINKVADDSIIWIGQRMNDTKMQNNIRGDLRVSVEIPVQLESVSLETPVKALVKNISAGGLFFLAEDAFFIGMHIFFEMTIERNNLYLSAEVVNKVPTEKENVWGYGCRFTSLDATNESKIRQFVFQEDCRYRMNMKAKS